MSVFFGVVGAASATSALTITDNTWAGQMLVATPATSGDALEWYQCDENGANCVDTMTSGAQSPAVTAGDTYEVMETGATPSATTSPVIASSQPTNAANPPVVHGVAQEGDTLTFTQGAWSAGSPSISDEWVRCTNGTCTGVLDANQNPEYTLTANDIGSSIEIAESATYGPTTVPGTSSSATDTVASAAPVRTSGPSITGADRQGQTLAVSVGTWTNDPAYSFQWLRCTIVCTAIPGAMGSTYALTDADVGTSLEVDVTGSNTYGSATATSSRTGIVSATTTTRLLTSSSTAHVNQPVTLTAFVYSSADTADPSGSMTFYDDGVAISGCVGVPVSGSGQGVTVSCSTSFGVSSPSLTAAFTPSPSSPLTASSSSAQTMSVLADGSTVTLDVPAQAVRHQPVTYTASVSPAGDLTGPIVPGGTVEFLDHGRRIKGCTRVPLHNGGATCTTRYSATGRERITVRYAGSVNFAGASSPVRTVRILRALPRRTVTATMQWTFHYTPAYTRILALVLHGVPAHSQVTVRCVGRGCPYHARTRSERRALQTLNLESGFRGRRLHVRAQVVVEVTRAQYVGKYYRFTILARRQPSIVISCLAPGSHRPGVGCRR